MIYPRLLFLGILSLSACANSTAPKQAHHSPDAIYQKARSAQAKEQTEEALKLFNQAAKTGHVSAACFVAALDAGAKSATTALDTLLEKNSKNAACLFLRARESIFAAKLVEGQEYAKAATIHGGKDPLAWATLGFAEFRRQEYLAAADAFENSTALDDSITQNIFNVGYALYLGGEYSQARPWLRKVLADKSLDQELQERAKKSLAIIDGGIWICPMHPQETGKQGAQCSICKMDLQPVSSGVRSDKD